MANGYPLFDVGRSISARNDSGTTAIAAGDIVYASGATTAPLGSTTGNAVRSDYAISDILVKSTKWGTTAQSKQVIGVALTDGAADGNLTVALEGVFMNQLDASATAVSPGHPVQAADATTNGLDTLGVDCGTTSTNIGLYKKIGFALTGANSTKDFIVWKLSK